jgi:CRISPR-associated protein Csd1
MNSPLASLATYAATAGLTYGWRRRRVAWVLDITDPQAPRIEPHGHLENTPYVRRSGPKPSPRPACDTVDYLTGRHRTAWINQLRDFAETDHGPAARAARNALVAGALDLVPAPDGAAPSDLVALRANGQLLHQDPALARFWQALLRAGLASGSQGWCLSCAALAPLARLIPAYLPPHAFGATGAGDLALFPSAGNRAGADPVPVCLECACAAGAALPALADMPDRCHRTHDGRLLLWWNPDATTAYPLGRLLAEPDRDALAAAGTDGRLCVMLLQPVTGRISINWHLDEPADVLHRRIHHWYDATGVYNGWDDSTTLTGIPAMHAQLGRWEPRTHTYDRRRVTAPEGGLWAAALFGQIPRLHAQAALIATRRDNRISAGRVGLLQLWTGDQSRQLPGDERPAGEREQPAPVPGGA